MTATSSLELEAALDLRRRDFWPVAIHRKGATIRDRDGNEKIATGKEPIGKAWGAAQRTEQELRRLFRQNPGAGVGLCLGPARAPGGRWFTDLEGDGPRAAESLARLLGGNVATMGHDSTRGAHNFFVADTTDGERFLALLVDAKAEALKGEGKAGVYKLAELPDLEIRVGGFKPGGIAKQCQSVVPPTQGDNGKPREWHPGVSEPAELPEAAYAFLGEIAERKRSEASANHAAGNGAAMSLSLSTQANGTANEWIQTVTNGPTVEDRAIAYLGTCEPAIQGERGSDKTFGVACRLGPGFDLQPDVTFRLLRDHYSPRCVPPWPDDQLRHKVEDAYANEQRRGWLLTQNTQSRRNGPATDNGAANNRKPPSAVDQQLAKRARTDLGNGERLVVRCGQNVRYCHPWKKWLAWDKTRWKADDTAAARRIAKRTVRGILNEAATVDDDDERKAHTQWWHASENKARVDAMLSCASSEKGIPILPDDMDTGGFLLNVLNGTIDLRTGKLREHRRDDLITRMAPVYFDPGAKCSTWLSVLGEVFAGDKALITFWQALCGICLTADVSNQILPVLYGAGANGKTTLLTALLEILGPDYAITAPPGLLTLKKGERHPTELAALFGKRLVVDSETAEGARFNENLVKQLTGGDKISARRMREDFWTFQPTHKILLCTNHKPDIQETKAAIWRRVKLVPFNVAIPDDRQDAKLPEKLRAEYPGILAWCVEGCRDWLELGLDIPTAVEDATQKYRAESDTLAEFLESECIVAPSVSARATPLYTRYQKWAGDEAVNQRRFGRALAERGFVKHTNNGTIYEGLSLRAESTPDNERERISGINTE